MSMYCLVSAMLLYGGLVGGSDALSIAQFEVKSVQAHEADITSLTVHERTGRLISTSLDGGPKIWAPLLDSDDSVPISVPNQRGALRTFGAAWLDADAIVVNAQWYEGPPRSPRANHLIGVTGEGELLFNRQLKPRNIWDGVVVRLPFLAHPDGDDVVRVWTLPELEEVGRLELSEHRIISMEWGPDDGSLLIGTDKGAVKHWRISEDEVSARREITPLRVTSIAVASDKTIIASASNHRIFTLSFPGLEIISDKRVEYSPRKLALNEDRIVLFVSGDVMEVDGEGHVSYMLLGQNQLTSMLKLDNVFVRSLAFDPRRGVLYAGTSDGMIHAILLRHRSN